MAYENLCMYCFEDMGGESICPHCGRDSRTAVPQIQMLPGSLVYNDRFLIGRALGQDATGIVYSAYDTKRESKLRLREYLPRDCAERLNDGSVVPVAGLEDQFDAGLKKLRASVESVEDPRKRHFFFEENGTAYIAQRKNTAAAAPAGRDRRRDDVEEESGSGIRRVLIIAGVAVAVVLIAAIIIISMLDGAMDTNKDVTSLPTLDPDQVWVPVQTPTPTPYVSPTFAALVDPDLSWMDYTYDGDVEEDYKKQEALASTPKPDEDASKYTTVSAKSSTSEIKKFQQQMVTLGWLDYTGVTGKYDAATKQAVKDFQSYINSAYNPDKKLTVDGIAGPKTLQWLDATQAMRPTASPTPVVTPDPDEELTVDENSSAKDIVAVQRKLIYLGVMPEGSDDGVYGASTATAVKQFQKRVNKLQGYEVLEETGVVDPLTMSFLNYYVENWENNKPTPEPENSPTPTPTPAPEGESMDAINANSPKESIKYVQQMLIAIGLLPEGSADGVYGSDTISAVAFFQEWVNEQLKKEVIKVSGEADQMTLAYLEYCEGNNMYPKGTPVPTEAPTQAPTEVPTEVPTEEPTEAPTQEPEQEPDEGNIAVGPDSEKESIQFVQSMLSQIGFLDEDDVDGVYGNGTKGAVAAFQQWVNEQRGQEDLEVTGLCDALTLQWMEYCVDQELIYKDEADPTEAPTPEPTQAPTQEPEDEPQTGSLGEISVTIGGQQAGDEVIVVSEGTIQVNWSVEGELDSYYVYVDDSNGTSVLKGEGVSNTSFEVHSSRMNPGEIYTLTVGALPANGGEEDIVWKQVLFMLEEEEQDEPTQAPEEPDPTDEPVQEPDPTEAPEDEPTQAPEKGTVTEVAISIGGVSAGSSPIVMEGDSFQITWNGGDEVAAYSYQIKDSEGNIVVEKQNTDQTGITAKASAMQAGMVYTITVGALPVNGTNEDVVWSKAQFMLQEKATEAPTPEPTAEPTPTPTPEPEVAVVGKPAIVVDGSAHQQDGIPYMTGDTITISWNAQGDVESYNVYIENQAGDRVSLGDTTNTSKTVSTDSLPAGLYTVYVGALPANGTKDDMVWNSYTFGIPAPTPKPTEEPTPAPTEEPTPEPTEEPAISLDQPIDGTADADTILQLQMRLYSFGLLSTDGLEEGVLDQKTLLAIVDFQNKVNEQYEAGLIVIDPADPNVVIDVDTLWWLFEKEY